MKRLSALILWMVCLAMPLAAQTVRRMADLDAAAKADATHIALTGTLSTAGNSDFRQLRDLCWQLESLDLSQADCPTIPRCALHSRHALKRLALPDNVRLIDAQAFYACDALTDVCLPPGLDSIAPEAFAGCTALRTLTLHGRPAIGAFAFARCTGLRRIVLNSDVPPVADATAFAGIAAGQVRLVVPRGSEGRYARAEGWRTLMRATPLPADTCRPEVCLLPAPSSPIVRHGGSPLSVLRKWRIKAEDGLDNEVRQARRVLAERTAGAKRTKGPDNILTLATDSTMPAEAYHIYIHARGADIKGGSAAGVFYGVMTLDQLLRGDAGNQVCAYVPALTLDDAPRTAMRELMVDPARIFIPLPVLKDFVVEMARWKYNALHLHLVDDQAWRIEIKRYPELTQQASERTGMDDMLMPISGYYTQDEMRELVRFAADYHVDIIPEIEMPGHEVAAIHCFPQLTCGAKEVPIRTTCGVSNELLCPGEPFVYEFLGHVLGELAAVFPSPYVHLGGDEAGNPALGCWTDCPKCRALKRRLGIEGDRREDNWRLQEHLFNSIIDTLRTKHGKTPMFWYETDFKRIPEGCIVFAWRHGLTAAAIRAAVANDARIMLCPGEHCYLDYPMAGGDMPEVNWGMPITSLAQTYRLDPAWGFGPTSDCPTFEERHLAGVAGTLWSECINSSERLYYQAFPRALALAEAGWTPQARRDAADFDRRLQAALRDMARRGICRSAVTWQQAAH